MYTTLGFILALATSVAAFSAPDGVCKFDVNRYTGGWYELASSSFVGQTLEAGCICSAAYYTTNVTNPGNIDITNSCIRNGQFWSVTGNAFAAANDQPKGNLRVVINDGSPASNDTSPNYFVLKQWFTDLESNAPQFSLVGGATENMWWFLGRSPNWNARIWNNAFHVLEANEYNVTDFRIPDQSCQFLGRHGANNLIPPIGRKIRR